MPMPMPITPAPTQLPTEGTTKSCISCPSLVRPQDTMEAFGRQLSAPMCGRFGYVLGLPGMADGQLNDLWAYMGTRCGAHGQERPLKPVAFQTEITSPSPSYMMDGAQASTESERRGTSNCSMCKYQVPEHDVKNRFGLDGALCGATGRLIIRGRGALEAKACPVRRPLRPGDEQPDIEYMLPLPRYEKLTNIFMNGSASQLDPNAPIVEPREYATDKPVNTNSAAAGIVSWRKVVNPRDDTKIVYLPIYGDAAFTPEQLELIPRTGDDEHPELYKDHGGVIYRVAVAWMGLDETPILWGEAGTGKTELFRHMAWLMNLPFRRISITESSEVDDLIGKLQYTPERGTYFQYGRLVHAWGQPGVTCLDEPNVGPQEVWQAIRPLTDNSKQMVIDQNKGELQPRHDDCYLGMAANPAWDPRNIGANQLADADGSRLFHIAMELPPPKIEQAIIRERCRLDGFEISDAELKQVMDIAKDIRALSKEQTIQVSWGVRNQIKAARALQYLDPIEAFRVAVVDSLEPEQGSEIIRVVNTVVSGTVGKKTPGRFMNTASSTSRF